MSFFIGVGYWRWGLFVLFMCPRVDDTEVGRGKGALGCLLVTGPTSRWPPACGHGLRGDDGPCCPVAGNRWQLDIGAEVRSNLRSALPPCARRVSQPDPS